MPPERILARATGRPEEPEEPDLDKALSEALLALDRRLSALENRIASDKQPDLYVEDNLLVFMRPDGSRCSIDLLSLPRRAVQRSLTFQRDPETHQISGATQTEETT